MMFSSSVDAYTITTTSSSLDTCSQSLFERLEQYISQAQFVEAQDELFSLFRSARSEDEGRDCYRFLFELLPHCSSLGVLENNLQNLLDDSASFVKEQEQLALLLARRYLQEGKLKKAMLCFAKALQMNRSQDNYLAAFEVFLHYFQTHKEQRLCEFLINSTPGSDTIASHLKMIEALKTFGIPKEGLLPFFQKILNRINLIPTDKQAAYVAHEQAVRDLRDSPWEPQKTVIERYWEAMQTFRACFAGQGAQTVQKEAFAAMKQLIALFIEDIFTLIGPPPCHYDLRAMGSLGRKEMCPYSDLECMLLVEDEQHLPYFNRMIEVLELQIASLGETQGLPFMFTCLPNPSGLHLDNSPLQDTRLAQTPEQMAQFQKQTDSHTKCMVLKTTSLYQTTPQLYIDYQTHLQSIRNNLPFLFFDVCKQRIHDFSFAWQNHFDRKIATYNIKSKFVETLYHPLSDLALYCDIKSTNTLEIADALIDRKVLPKKMKGLLKESLSLIYEIRVRTHQQHRTQEERADLIPEEIAALEKCYWQILIPLHTCLKKLFAPKEPHRHFFEKLCQTADPDELTKQLKGTTSILEAVLHLPDSSTTRPIYTMKMNALQASLTAITDPLSPSIPRETSVQIKALHFPFARSLQHSFAKKIMEGLDLKQEYTNSAHRVCRLQYGVYDLHFKQTPSNPLMEYAIHSLVSRIAGEYTPPTALVRFDVEQRGQKKSYPVLISQTIPGENLKTAWPQAVANRSYTWNLLIAILTKPQDGRLSNYILHEEDIFCIDNDLSFAEPVTKFGPFRTVHFSAAPFCLFTLDTLLNQQVLEEFAALNAVGICKNWVEEVIEKEKEYLQLFTKEERKKLYEKDNCTLGILLKEGTFSTLNLQFWLLQNTIQTAINQNKTLTSGDLLQLLVNLTDEKVGGYVYRAYNNAKTAPKEKLQAALDRKQESSVSAVEYHKNCLGKIPSFDEIEKVKKYSLKEATQELFHAFLIESEHAYLKDSQGKGALGANFKKLENPNRELKILLSIKELIKRSPQKIFSLSFYYSTLLDTNWLTSFLHPALKKLDLRHCNNIDIETVWLIKERCFYLRELILTSCSKITEIGESLLFPRLFTFNYLETLEISHTPCTKLLFTAPKLRSLNISHNPELRNLGFRAPLLSEINAKKSTKIQLLPSAKRFITQALIQTPKNLATAPLQLVNDPEIVMTIITKNGLALEYATVQFKKARQIVLTAVKENGKALQYAAEELKSDKEIVLVAVERNGLALEYATEELKSDREIVVAALQQDGYALQYASEKLKSDREIVLVAVKRNGLALKYATEKLKSDREIVVAALQQDGRALEYASEKLRSNKKIVLAAVQKNGYALGYVAEELKSDREIVVAALQQDGYALQYASEKLKSDKEIVLNAVQKDGQALIHASEKLKNNREIVLAAVQQNGQALKYASEELRSNKKIVLAAVQKNGGALFCAAKELKSDREIVLAAVQQNGQALKYASEELRNDEEIRQAALKQNPKSIT